MTTAMTIVISVTVFANLFLADRFTSKDANRQPEAVPDHPTGMEFYV
jgi:hypothetical protein